MSNDRGEEKRGPVRPTVIEGEAEEIAREDVSAEKEATAEDAAGKVDDEAGDEASAAAEETAVDSASSSEDETSRADDDSSDAGPSAHEEAGAQEDAAAEDKARETSEAAAGEPAPKKRTGLKVLGVLALMGTAAGGGIYAYDQYGPGRELAALKAQVAALAEAREKGPETLAAKIDEKVGPLTEKVKALSQNVATLSGRVETLEKKVAALAAEQEKTQAAAAGMPDELKQRLDALKARLDELTQARAADAEKVQALEAAVKDVKAQAEAVAAALEKAMTAAEKGGAASANAEGGPAGVESGEAGTAAAALQVAALARKLAALEMKVAALEEGAAEGGNAVAPEALKGLEDRLARLQGDLEALRKAAAARDQRIDEALKAVQEATVRAEEALAAVQALKEEAASRPAYTPPPVGAAFAALREKVQTGRPFAAELKALAGFLPDAPAVADLSKAAETGVPTVQALLASLDEIAARHAAEKRRRLEAMAEEGIAGSLKARLMQVVKVRRKGEVDWAEVLAEAARAGHARGLAAALNVLGQVKGAMPEDVARWRRQAEARLAADAALAALAGDVVRAMTGEIQASGEGVKGTTEQ